MAKKGKGRNIPARQSSASGVKSTDHLSPAFVTDGMQVMGNISAHELTGNQPRPSIEAA